MQRVTTIANDDTGTLYILVFGTPEDDWEETYKVGKQLYNPILLDPDTLRDPMSHTRRRLANTNVNRFSILPSHRKRGVSPPLHGPCLHASATSADGR